MDRTSLTIFCLLTRFLTFLGKKKKEKVFGVLKIDMHRAYDKVNRNFLKTVLLSMNFSNIWVNWIMKCVISIQYSLLVNGSPTQLFNSSKGLR